VQFRDPERFRCPVCENAALSPAIFVGITRHGCAGCGGAWVDDVDLEQILLDLGGVPDEPLGPPAPVVSPRACPRCGEPMTSEHSYGDEPHVKIDLCAAHGAWFDKDELATVIEALSVEIAGRRLPNEASSVTVLLWLVRRRWRKPTRTRGG
jgi:Zn-finger nucleic acid-binding protein